MIQSFRRDLLVEPFFLSLLTSLEYFATGGLWSSQNIEDKSPEEYLGVAMEMRYPVTTEVISHQQQD